MREVKFGDWQTWTDWGLTLTGLSLSAPVYKSAFVAVPGRDGDLDLSTVLTDGEPRYNNRTLETTYEISTGSRMDREALFIAILNQLDGRRRDIILPDDADHYLTGRLQVVINYNDVNHGKITIKAVVEPWRQAITGKTKTLTASSTTQTTTLTNVGRRVLTPEIVITGSGASVTLGMGSKTWTLSTGTYLLPDLQLQPGDNSVTYRGTGSLTVNWREAIL